MPLDAAPFREPRSLFPLDQVELTSTVRKVIACRTVRPEGATRTFRSPNDRKRSPRSDAASPPSVAVTDGSSSRPSRKPVPSRWRRRRRPASSTKSPTASRTATVSRRGGTAGRRAAEPSSRAQQANATGHSPQSGVTGRQSVAPSSIIAWLKSPGRPGSIHRAARSATSAASRGSFAWPSSAASRATTRMTLPSTTALGSPKAIEATAAAV